MTLQISVTKPYVPGAATGITLGSTSLVGGVNATVAGLTLTAATSIAAIGSISSQTSFAARAPGVTGYIFMSPGGTSNAGYVAWFKGDGATRLGYMGFSNTNIELTLENGASFTVVGGAASFSSTVKTGVYTVATLPTAGTIGRRAMVSDALALTFGGVVVGGGANACPVYDSGVAWGMG